MLIMNRTHIYYYTWCAKLVWCIFWSDTRWWVQNTNCQTAHIFLWPGWTPWAGCLRCWTAYTWKRTSFFRRCRTLASQTWNSRISRYYFFAALLSWFFHLFTFLFDKVLMVDIGWYSIITKTKRNCMANVCGLDCFSKWNHYLIFYVWIITALQYYNTFYGFKDMRIILLLFSAFQS